MRLQSHLYFVVDSCLSSQTQTNLLLVKVELRPHLERHQNFWRSTNSQLLTICLSLSYSRFFFPSIQSLPVKSMNIISQGLFGKLEDLIHLLTIKMFIEDLFRDRPQPVSSQLHAYLSHGDNFWCPDCNTHSRPGCFLGPGCQGRSINASIRGLISEAAVSWQSSCAFLSLCVGVGQLRSGCLHLQTAGRRSQMVRSSVCCEKLSRWSDAYQPAEKSGTPVFSDWNQDTIGQPTGFSMMMRFGRSTRKIRMMKFPPPV